MKQYLLSVAMIDGAPPRPQDEIQRAYERVDEFNAELLASGAWVFGGGLQPADIATVVREEDGEIMLTDGPFAESKEHIGGFWIIEVDDLDAALAWATKATRACAEPVEVRPFQEVPEG
ncbi:MAG TPA: YciI family protein [Acidimicrobiales bacterium]|nr:YciI family protein [Acidimicrobiales bacterium]